MISHRERDKVHEINLSRLLTSLGCTSKIPTSKLLGSSDLSLRSSVDCNLSRYVCHGQTIPSSFDNKHKNAYFDQRAGRSSINID